MKVLELSKELGLTPKETIQMLQGLGVNVKHHNNNLEKSHVDMVRRNKHLFTKTEEALHVRKAFGIDRIDGKWGVTVFHYPAGDPSKVTVGEFYTDGCKYKSNTVEELKRLLSDQEYSDIFKEED